MNDVILEFEGITKRFFGIIALEDVTLQLQKGHILGLIGENGAGKSTLMNILGGVLPHDEGTMHLDGQPYTPKSPRMATERGVAFIHQELNLFTNLTIAENIFIDSFPGIGATPLINKHQIVEKTTTLLESINLNLSPNTLIESLAPGERQLVEIAKALHGEPHIIIFDEPTTSLTAKETERLFAIIEQLKVSGKSIIYISHILGDVQKLADDIAVLRDGKVVGTGTAQELDINRMISMMVGRDLEKMYPERHPNIQTEEVLTVETISQSGIVKDINFTLHKGEVLGVFGLMGSGRTELARMIFGIDEYEKGQVLVNGEKLPPQQPRECIRKGMAFVTEDRREEGLLMHVSIADNIGLVALPDFIKTVARFVNGSDLLAAIKDIIQTLRIKTASEKLPAKSLSGGNQQKVVIGKWLMANPSVLIMDEPTRGIDVGSKYEIYVTMGELAAQGTGVLFISSEIEELMGICDRILVMSRGEMLSEFTRNEFSQEDILRSAFRQNGSNGHSQKKETMIHGNN
jgi:ribose transport system ATP-binding protein